MRSWESRCVFTPVEMSLNRREAQPVDPLLLRRQSDLVLDVRLRVAPHQLPQEHVRPPFGAHVASLLWTSSFPRQTISGSTTPIVEVGEAVQETPSKLRTKPKISMVRTVEPDEGEHVQ